MKIFRTIFFFSFIFLLGWILYCLLTLPNLSGLGNKTRFPSISVLSDQNKIVGSLGDVYAGSLQISQVSKNLINAIIVTEDKRFYQHNGVDVRGLLRAIFFNIKEGRYAQGASTITQQLSKMIFLNQDKNLSRKLRELLISFHIEYKFSKEEILEMYLNRVYLGSGLYGVKSASRRYFSKTPNELSIAESSILAGLLKAPSRLSPLVDKQLSIKRAKIVLNLLFKENYLDYKDLEQAKNELNKIKNQNDIELSVGARYFIDWIYSQTPDEILRSKKDLLIKSTFNARLQNMINLIIKKQSLKIDENIQIAVVIMDYKGAVKAVKGGKDWNKSKFNRATQSKRQLGSVFKTYVYLTALDMGYSVKDKVLDAPITKNNWTPKNFGNNYEGEITLKRAFAKSSNVVAVRISEKIGREFIINQIKKLGVTSKIPNEPSMPLGVASMSLLEVVGSYGPICGSGIAVIPYAIDEIILRNGNSYWKRNSPQRKKIINNKTHREIKKLLKAVISEGTANKLSKLPIDILGKTGTTQNNRDAWFIGCAKGHVIGVWVGRDDDKSMKNVYGSTIPLNIFKDIIEEF